MSLRIASLITFFATFHYVVACEMQLAPILLFMSKTMTPYDWQPLMKNSNCSPEITQNIFERLKDAEGKISTEQFVADYSTKINITPAVLEVINLETLLRQKTHNFFKKVVINGALSARLLLLDKWEQINLQCQNCEQSSWNNSSSYGSNFGDKGLRESTLIWQLRITTQQDSKNLLITTEVANMKKVLRAKSAIASNSHLTEEQIEIAYLSQDANVKVFEANLADLTNYELIKPLQMGEILTLNHLKAKKLVHMGKNIEAIIKNKGIELSLPAQALQSGGMGQTIQIKNLKNNKQLTGEIIGLNKVQITL